MVAPVAFLAGPRRVLLVDVGLGNDWKVRIAVSQRVVTDDVAPASFAPGTVAKGLRPILSRKAVTPAGGHKHVQGARQLLLDVLFLWVMLLNVVVDLSQIVGHRALVGPRRSLSHSFGAPARQPQHEIPGDEPAQAKTVKCQKWIRKFVKPPAIVHARESLLELPLHVRLVGLPAVRQSLREEHSVQELLRWQCHHLLLSPLIHRFVEGGVVQAKRG
mmetsp:Transcript_96688/g.221538  ORF Transcript_96688/g.221538 Transcript_96688/m.221538 type:complete len:217 (+) Transcript_96688:163-813(+)